MKEVKVPSPVPQNRNNKSLKLNATKLRQGKSSTVGHIKELKCGAEKLSRPAFSTRLRVGTNRDVRPSAESWPSCLVHKGKALLQEQGLAETLLKLVLISLACHTRSFSQTEKNRKSVT